MPVCFPTGASQSSNGPRRPSTASDERRRGETCGTKLPGCTTGSWSSSGRNTETLRASRKTSQPGARDGGRGPRCGLSRIVDLRDQNGTTARGLATESVKWAPFFSRGCHSLRSLGKRRPHQHSPVKCRFARSAQRRCATAHCFLCYRIV